MTKKQAVKFLRDFIGERGEHRPNCNTSGKVIVRVSDCDCYAKPRETAHEALDAILAGNPEPEGKVTWAK